MAPRPSTAPASPASADRSAAGSCTRPPQSPTQEWPSGLARDLLLRNHDGIAVVQRVRRVEYQPIVGADAVEKLDHLAVVAPDLHAAKLDLAVLTDRRDARPLAAEEEDVGRHRERTGALERQRHLDVGAG